VSSTNSPFGQNEWLVEEMYRKFRADPSSVDESWHEFLRGSRPESADPGNGQAVAADPPPAPPAAPAAPPAPPAPLAPGAAAAWAEGLSAARASGTFGGRASTGGMVRYMVRSAEAEVIPRSRRAR